MRPSSRGEGKGKERWAVGWRWTRWFEDNHKVRKALVRLGIRVLGVGEVREVLKRWVEAFERA